MKARGAAFVAAARSLALSTSSHPLPLTPHESQLIETFLAVITALFVLIPMCYLVGSYALFPVKERSAGAKHLMAMAGCGPLPYWLGTYLYDLTAHKARAASPRGPPPAAQIGCRASRAHLLDPPHSFGVVVLLRSFSPKVVVLTVMGAFWLFSDVAFVGTRSAAVVRGRAYGRYHLGAHLCVLAFFFGIAAPAALCAAALPCALPAARLSPDRLSLPPTASLPAAAGHQATLVSLMLYGAAALPLAYLLARAFDQPTSAQARLLPAGSYPFSFLFNLLFSGGRTASASAATTGLNASPPPSSPQPGRHRRLVLCERLCLRRRVVRHGLDRRLHVEHELASRPASSRILRPSCPPSSSPPQRRIPYPSRPHLRPRPTPFALFSPLLLPGICFTSTTASPLFALGMPSSGERPLFGSVERTSPARALPRTSSHLFAHSHTLVLTHRSLMPFP